MLYGWGTIFPKFVQRAMVLLLTDLDAAAKGELDIDQIQRLAHPQQTGLGVLGLRFFKQSYLNSA